MYLCRSAEDESDEKEIFKGSENRLTMNQTYTHQFQCMYILDSYPFDTQVKVSPDFFFRCLDFPSLDNLHIDNT